MLAAFKDIMAGLCMGSYKTAVTKFPTREWQYWTLKPYITLEVIKDLITFDRWLESVKTKHFLPTLDVILSRDMHLLFRLRSLGPPIVPRGCILS